MRRAEPTATEGTRRAVRRARGGHAEGSTEGRGGQNGGWSGGHAEGTRMAVPRVRSLRMDAIGKLVRVLSRAPSSSVYLEKQCLAQRESAFQ